MAESAKHEPPAPIRLELGGTLRFAVGSAEGPRSSTWNVVGATNDRDVYVGNRANMNEVKLPLHRSGQWQMAYTTAFATEIGLDLHERRLTRFERAEPLAGGWRRAASIVVPTTSLRSRFTERESSLKRPISWWGESDPQWAIWFEVLISDIQFDESQSFDGIGLVGTIPLPGVAV